MICHTLPLKLRSPGSKFYPLTDYKVTPHCMYKHHSHTVTHLYLLEVNRFLDDLVILW